MESEETMEGVYATNSTSTTTGDGQSPTYVFEFASASFGDSDLEDGSDPGDNLTSNSDARFLNFVVEENDGFDNDNPGSSWRKGVARPSKLPFTGQSGLQIKLEDSTPFDYLHLLVNDEMVANLVTETNRYASQVLDNKTLAPKSRFHKWIDVTVEEMWAFLGLITSMGLIVINHIEDYWSPDPLYKLPFFSSVMKRNRFLTIMSFLHLCNEKNQVQEGQPGYDPFFKIKSFVDSLIHNFKSAFYPGDKVCVDEGMVAWRGPLSFRVFDPAKQEKLGIKLFQLCDCNTGYCCNLEFYTGMQETSSHGAAFDIVNRLISPYLGCGRTLYVDSSYTSPDLFSYLRENGTKACGSVKKNMKNGPPKTMIPKVDNNDDAITTLTNGQLNFIQFMDKREVRLLTTAHGADMVATGKMDPVTKEVIMKPQAVYDYHQNMGAVDRNDMMVAFNVSKQKSMDWWKKTFFHLFHLAVLNAYIMHRATEVKVLSHRVFRRELAKQLVQRFVPVTPTSPQSISQGCGSSYLFRFSVQHFPKRCVLKPGSKSKYSQRACRVCLQSGKRKRTVYECSECNVGLHPAPCFRIYHTRNIKH